MRTLIIDNYDSFTYNLVHLIEQFTNELEVKRNDEIDIRDVEKFERVIISPGPGLPLDAGITIQVIDKYSTSKNILGVCLGMQAIAECFSGKLKNLDEPMHGISTPCTILTEVGIFKGLPEIVDVGHYHSWVVDPDHIPNNFDITAQTKEGLIMAMRHNTLKIEAVQFHPESILTPLGREMIKNWMQN